MPVLDHLLKDEDEFDYLVIVDGVIRHDGKITWEGAEVSGVTGDPDVAEAMAAGEAGRMQAMYGMIRKTSTGTGWKTVWRLFEPSEVDLKVYVSRRPREVD